jgi:hypothetical protein
MQERLDIGQEGLDNEHAGLPSYFDVSSVACFPAVPGFTAVLGFPAVSGFPAFCGFTVRLLLLTLPIFQHVRLKQRNIFFDFAEYTIFFAVFADIDDILLPFSPTTVKFFCRIRRQR